MLRLKRSRLDITGDNDILAFSEHSWYTQLLQALPSLARDCIYSKNYSIRFDSVNGYFILVSQRRVIVWKAPTKRSPEDAEPQFSLLLLPSAEGDENIPDFSADNVVLFRNESNGEIGALVCSRYGKIRRWKDIQIRDSFDDIVVKDLNGVVRVEFSRSVFFLVSSSGSVYRLPIDRAQDFDASLKPPLIKLENDKGESSGVLSYLFSFWRSSPEQQTTKDNKKCGLYVSAPRNDFRLTASDPRTDSKCFVFTEGMYLWRVDGTRPAVENLDVVDALCKVLGCPKGTEITCYDLFATTSGQCFMLFYVGTSESGSTGRGTYIAQVEAEGASLTIVRVLSFDSTLPISSEARLVVTRSAKEFYAYVICGDKIIIAPFSLGFDRGVVAQFTSVQHLTADDTINCGSSSVGQLVCLSPSGVYGVFGPGFTTITAEAQADADQAKRIRVAADLATEASAAAGRSGQKGPAVPQPQEELNEDELEKLEEICRMYSEKGIMNSPDERELINSKLEQFLNNAKKLEDTVLSLAMRFVNRTPDEDFLCSGDPLVTMRYMKEKEEKYETYCNLLYHRFGSDKSLAASISKKALYSIARFGEWLRAALKLREVQARADSESKRNALASCVNEFATSDDSDGKPISLYCLTSRLVDFLPFLATRAASEAKDMNPHGVFLCAEGLYKVLTQLNTRTLAYSCDVIAPAILEVSRAIEMILKSVESSDSVDDATRVLFSKRAEFLLRFAQAYLAGWISKLKSDNASDVLPKYDEVFSLDTDIYSVNWKSMTEDEREAVLTSDDYQENGSLILQVLWDSKLYDDTKRLAQEFAVFKTIFAANDMDLITESMCQFGDVFEVKLLEYWEGKKTLSQLFEIQLTDDQLKPIIEYLENENSPYLHLLYLKYNQYAKAANALSWRVDEVSSKKLKAEYACLGKMAIHAVQVSNEPLPDCIDLERLERIFDFSLEQLADHELVDDLKNRSDCVTPRCLIIALVQSRRDETIFAAADFVKSAGGRYAEEYRSELGVALWSTVIPLTPWRKIAKVYAEKKWTDSDVEQAIEESKVCTVANHIYETNEHVDLMLSDFIIAMQQYTKSCGEISDVLNRILSTVKLHVTNILKGGKSPLKQ